MATVEIYTTPTCGYCRRAKELLRAKGVDFKEIDAAGKPELREWLRQRTGRHTVPQIFINGTSVGGFDDINALDRVGKLDPLLAAPSV